MPKVRSFEIPTVMKHGLGAVETLADDARALGMKRPLVVTDGGIVKAGLLDRVTKPLQAGRMDFAVFDKVVPNPPIATVDDGARLYATEKCDGVIGFGGGCLAALRHDAPSRGRLSVTPFIKPKAETVKTYEPGTGSGPRPASLPGAGI